MIFVVLGMHKSGTTLIAETLEASGIDMGCADSKGYDQRSYCERAEPLALNKQLLAEEETVFSLDLFETYTDEVPPAIRSAARELVSELTGRHADWGFKDPRTCLAWRLWGDVLDDCRLIGVWRPASEVFRHYMKRRPAWNPASWRRGYRVIRAWYRYNSAMLAILEDKPGRSHIVNYAAFMHDAEESAALGRFVQRPVIDRRQAQMYRSTGTAGIIFRVWIAVLRRFGMDIDGLERDLASAPGTVGQQVT